jgi:hypothetical protein
LVVVAAYPANAPPAAGSGKRFLSNSALFFTNAREALLLMQIDASAANFTQ